MKLHKSDWVTGAIVALALLGCSSKSDDDNIGAGGGFVVSFGGAYNAAGGKSATSTGSSNVGGAPVGTSATGGQRSLAALPKACPGLPVDSSSVLDAGQVCRGTAKELEPSQLDMLIMVDRTMSMTYCLSEGSEYRTRCADPNSTEPSRWKVLQQGLQTFLDKVEAMPSILRPRLGLGYFGYKGTTTGAVDDPECLAATYATPKVGIQDYTTARPALTQSMTELGVALGGQTPWQPSLQGALQYAQQWQIANPMRVTVVLFVTDGYPTECDVDMNNIVETVGEYYWGFKGTYNTVGSPNIRTFILGLGSEVAGANRYNLDDVASAGGTVQATIAGDVAGINAFADGLANITNAPVQCDFAIPPAPDGQIFNPELVQVIYSPYVGQKQEIPRAASLGGCGSDHGGWYFDDSTKPTKVILCPCSCADLGAGSVSVAFGCRPTPVFN